MDHQVVNCILTEKRAVWYLQHNNNMDINRALSVTSYLFVISLYRSHMTHSIYSTPVNVYIPIWEFSLIKPLLGFGALAVGRNQWRTEISSVLLTWEQLEQSHQVICTVHYTWCQVQARDKKKKSVTRFNMMWDASRG